MLSAKFLHEMRFQHRYRLLNRASHLKSSKGIFIRPIQWYGCIVYITHTYFMFLFEDFYTELRVICPRFVLAIKLTLILYNYV